MSSMILLGETIPQDSILEFAPSSNIIGPSGQGMIQAYMRSEQLPMFPDDWTWMYNAPSNNGNRYKGKFAKRAGKYVHDETGKKITDKQRATLGKLARDTAANGACYRYDVTASLDWAEGDYGDSRSCFWGANTSARHAMDDHDKYFALRFYDEDETGDGRAWLYHVDRDTVIIFNAYGSVELLEMASMLCQLRGKEYTYNRIALSNHGSAYGTLYLNSGMGYAVCKTDHAMAHKYSFDFELDCPNEHACDYCGDVCDEYEGTFYVESYGTICEGCYCENFFTCRSCDETYHDDNMRMIDGEAPICEYCFDDDAFTCTACNENFMDEDMAWGDGNVAYCTDCYDDNVAECTMCSTEYQKLHEMDTGDSALCQECFDVGFTRCAQCGITLPVDQSFPGIGEHKGKETCQACTAWSYGYIQATLVSWQLHETDLTSVLLTEQHVNQVALRTALNAVHIRMKFQAAA